MKKILAILMALVMVLGLAACGGSSEPAPAAPATNDAPAAAPEAAPEAPAEPEGDLVLYCTMTENDIDALLTAFNAKYPKIDVEVVNGSAGELVTRLTGERKCLKD